MLHHVMLEIYPADLGRAAEFWSMLGFKQVDPPEDMADHSTWFERDGTQIHLMRSDEPTVPERGHPASVEAIAPSGHHVELMAHPPGG